MGIKEFLVKNADLIDGEHTLGDLLEWYYSDENADLDDTTTDDQIISIVEDIRSKNSLAQSRLYLSEG